MTSHLFAQKWKASQLKERSASQEHFLDLCHLIGQPTPTPAESDPDGSWYTFERGAHKTGGGEGWEDYPPEMPDEEILRRLLVLNLARSRQARHNHAEDISIHQPCTTSYSS